MCPTLTVPRPARHIYKRQIYFFSFSGRVNVEVLYRVLIGPILEIFFLIEKGVKKLQILCWFQIWWKSMKNVFPKLKIITPSNVWSWVTTEKLQISFTFLLTYVHIYFANFNCFEISYCVFLIPDWGFSNIFSGQKRVQNVPFVKKCLWFEFGIN